MQKITPKKNFVYTNVRICVQIWRFSPPNIHEKKKKLRFTIYEEQQQQIIIPELILTPVASSSFVVSRTLAHNRNDFCQLINLYISPI